MSKRLELLLVEDSPDDADLLLLALRRGGFAPAITRVETADAFRKALAEQSWQLIISDVNVPSFGAERALAILTETGLSIPFIVVSGHLKTEDAVIMMRAGAEDFIQKDDIARLVPAVERALRDAELERARAAATEEAERYGSILDEAAAEIYWVDASSLSIEHVNQGACKNSGYLLEDLQGQSFALLLQWPLEQLRSALQPVYDGQHAQLSFEADMYRADGSSYPADLRVQLLSGYLVVLAIDLTEKKAIADQLRKLSQAVEQSPSGVVIVDRTGHIEYVNRSFVEMHGYESGEVIGIDLGELITQQSPSQRTHQLRDALNNGGSWRGELHTRRKDGHTIWEYVSLSPIQPEITPGPNGLAAVLNPAHFLVMLEDITVRKEYEQKLMRQASFDELTKLPNRLLAFDRLSVALADARRNNNRVALFFIDLDNFKNVNDTLGHFAGDALLIEAAGRLQSCLRETTTLARFGGDEFILVMPELDSPNSARVLAQRILKVLQHPFHIHGRELFISASIGITICPDDGETTQILLQNADAAMYRSKEQGKNAFSFFTPEMNRLAAQRLTLETQLRRALPQSEFHLVYQPVVSARSLSIVAVEVLLRWQNSELGLVAPDQFIPIAEETGQIVPIGEWVLRESCRTVAQWQQEIAAPLRLAVNVSARQFTGSGMVTTVRDALVDSGLPAELLELEITERLVLHETAANSSQLHQINEMGVRLSVDDFGTGYSALSYLKRFPFDVLKIDRSFVRDVTRDRDNAALAKAIIAMAHGLDMQVIAEGVETVEQRDFLLEHGCDMMQGYFFSRPLPADQFIAMIKEIERRIVSVE
ncbi:EAL domain-containing protein [Permianibacter sp. IMCC34836]|uniref:EAL domain-containing protein n=1 Tax=Permianibacter fluminis TaxID=2738515 RepID=UPI001556AD73|nr:EAL domain-containing protein [Permianibacter fluminis]NQD37190.1 EAL domain-containing protein [Permianibacter fluminis]